MLINYYTDFSLCLLEGKCSGISWIELFRIELSERAYALFCDINAHTGYASKLRNAFSDGWWTKKNAEHARHINMAPCSATLEAYRYSAHVGRSSQPTGTNYLRCESKNLLVDKQ